MRYPPSAAIDDQASWLYRGWVVLFASLLIATWLYHFSQSQELGATQFTLAVLALGSVAWALRDAWRAPVGQLRFAQGAWLIQREDQAPVEGTLRPYIDLQNYILVRFVATAPIAPKAHITKQWFHLEARQIASAGRSAQWLALRRAVYARPSPSQDTLAGEEAARHHG